MPDEHDAHRMRGRNTAVAETEEIMSDRPGENHRKIICIEDDPLMSNLLSLILTGGGFEVVCAALGKEGLELITEDRPDLVLLDLMMPDIDGWAIYNMMKNDDAMKDIPVIVVTAKAGEIDKVIANLAKVDDYITKPFGPAELVHRINRVLGGADAG